MNPMAYLFPNGSDIVSAHNRPTNVAIRFCLEDRRALWMIKALDILQIRDNLEEQVTLLGTTMEDFLIQGEPPFTKKEEVYEKILFYSLKRVDFEGVAGLFLRNLFGKETATLPLSQPTGRMKAKKAALEPEERAVIEAWVNKTKKEYFAGMLFALQKVEVDKETKIAILKDKIITSLWENLPQNHEPDDGERSFIYLRFIVAQMKDMNFDKIAEVLLS